MRRFTFCSLLLLLVISETNCSKADEPLWLVRDGHPRVTIVRGAQDEYAAERLRRWVKDKSGTDMNIVSADANELPRSGCVILVGSAASNRRISSLAKQLRLDVSPKELTDQGYLAKRVCHNQRQWLLLAGGGREGAIYAVTDLCNWRLEVDNRNIFLDAVDTRQVPRFPYRWFWNWDHRMDWGGPGRVGAVAGGGTYYKGTKAAFLTDCKNCVDFMADHKFNGLILWGFLRDVHGGVEAGRELCRYAKHRGVRILPGVGASGYGGCYFQGKHRFNIDAWLHEHPECRAVGKDGKPRNVLCPSNKANQQWLDDGVEWLFETFDVGGANLEMGDFFVCYCDSCRRARAAIDSDEPDYYKDMAISHKATLEKMLQLAPQSWLSYATYTEYDEKMMRSPPKFLSIIPQNAICQWTLPMKVSGWTDGVRPMGKHNVGYLKWCSNYTRDGNDFFLQQLWDVAHNAAAAGLEGVITYGELSDKRPNVEIYYLILEALLWNPDMTLDEFVEQRLARVYGGRKAARVLLDIMHLVRTAKDRENLERCTHACRLAESARAIASPEERLRWDRLLIYLDYYEQAAKKALEK